eukprot:Tamp_10249.p1 GENE.Tamp_10249~~Tamp_10249.p1  ORF type:complete len:137 (-),score=0.46 Tamp_10249:791-1201(-)
MLVALLSLSFFVLSLFRSCARCLPPSPSQYSRFSFVCIDPGRPSHSTQVARAPRALSLTLPRAPPPLHNNHLPRTCSHIPKFRATGSHDNAVFLILYTLKHFGIVLSQNIRILKDHCITASEFVLQDHGLQRTGAV